MPIDEVRIAILEAVGMFYRTENLQNTIDQLLSFGFRRAELNLLASEHAIGEKLVHRYDKIGALADDPANPRTAYVSTEVFGDAQGGPIGCLPYVGATVATGAIVACGGTLATAIVAAVVTGGACRFVSLILAKRLGDNHANFLQEHIDKGGLLLWVKTRSLRTRRAVEIL